jgi:hypothetical protein
MVSNSPSSVITQTNRVAWPFPFFIPCVKAALVHPAKSTWTSYSQEHSWTWYATVDPSLQYIPDQRLPLSDAELPRRNRSHSPRVRPWRSMDLDACTPGILRSKGRGERSDSNDTKG